MRQISWTLVLIALVFASVLSRQTLQKRPINKNKHSTVRKPVRYYVIFSGTFNPFGLHHLEIVKSLLKEPDVVSVVVISTPGNFSYGTRLESSIDWSHRNAICQMTLMHSNISINQAWVSADKLDELALSKKYQTILEQKNADQAEKFEFRLGILIGADHSEDLSLLWKFLIEDQNFKKGLTIFVNPRKGFPLEKPIDSMNYRQLPEPSSRKFFGFSATKIRNLLRDKSLTQEEKRVRAQMYLAPPVIDYIFKNNLYQ